MKTPKASDGSKAGRAAASRKASREDVSVEGCASLVDSPEASRRKAIFGKVMRDNHNVFKRLADA